MSLKRRIEKLEQTKAGSTRKRVFVDRREAGGDVTCDGESCTHADVEAAGDTGIVIKVVHDADPGS